MKKRFQQEPALQQLASQYVMLELKTKSRDFQQWAQRYRPKKNAVPMLFIVDSEGKEIYNGVGAPQGNSLNQLLRRGIQETGGPKPNGSAKSQGADRRSLAALRKAERYFNMKKLDLATEQLAIVLDGLKPTGSKTKKGDSPSFSFEPANDTSKMPENVKALYDKLSDAAKKEVSELNKTIKGKKTQPLIGAVWLMRLKRVYKPLDGVASAIESAIAELQSQAEDVDLGAKAEAIDQARKAEENKNRKAAILAYERVVKLYPDTAAAKLCQTRIDQLKR